MKMNAQDCINNGKNPYMVTGRILFRLHLDKLPVAYNLLCALNGAKPNPVYFFKKVFAVVVNFTRK